MKEMCSTGQSSSSVGFRSIFHFSSLMSNSNTKTWARAVFFFFATGLEEQAY